MDDDKRQLILDATSKLILQHGLHGTSMSKIVKASGVPMGTIYRYFKDKDSLIAELYHDIVKQTAAYVCKDLDEKQPLRKQLEQIIKNIIELNKVHPDRFLSKAILDIVPRSDAERIALETHFKPVQRFAERGIEAGIFKPLPAELILTLAIGPIEWYFQVPHFHEHSFTAEQQAIFIDACWEAICLNPATTKDN